MEDHTSSATIDNIGKRRVFRNFPPAHYIFEIESFSSLLETKVHKYETKDFEAGGYKWRMVLYPSGKHEGDGRCHISLFLAMSVPADVSLGWEVNTSVNFLVYDGIRDRYLAVQDGGRMDWRFHKMKLDWGFVKFLSHDALYDPSNGFLVDDRCIFGVEVFVIESSDKGESLSFVKEPEGGVYTWKIDNFSALIDDLKGVNSDVFTVEGRKWYMRLFAKGDSRALGTHLSLYLISGDSETLQTRRKLYAKWLLRIKNQTNDNHHERPGLKNNWFGTPGRGFGFRDFMLLSTLMDPYNGYLVNDFVIVEAKFDLVSVTKDF